MLEISPSNTKEELDMLSTAIFGARFSQKVGYVLYKDDVPVGLAKIKIDAENSIVQQIGIKTEYRQLGYGDFFTRVILDWLSQVSTQITIDYYNRYYLPFGFQEVGQKMSVVSSSLTFPKKCKA